MNPNTFILRAASVQAGITENAARRHIIMMMSTGSVDTSVKFKQFGLGDPTRDPTTLNFRTTDLKKAKDAVALIKKMFKTKAFGRNDDEAAYESSAEIEGRSFEIAINDSTTYEDTKPGCVEVTFFFN